MSIITATAFPEWATVVDLYQEMITPFYNGDTVFATTQEGHWYDHESLLNILYQGSKIHSFCILYSTSAGVSVRRFLEEKYRLYSEIMAMILSLILSQKMLKFTIKKGI